MLFSMKQLLIETSQTRGAIALAHGGELLSSHTFGQSPEALKILLPSIQTLLRENNWELKELESIAVGIGPGSYTGMRVGITVAHTLAFALKLPIVSFCSLFTFIPPEKEGIFAYVATTKKGDYFVAKGVKERNERLTPLLQEKTSDLTPFLADVDFVVKSEESPPWNPEPLLSYLLTQEPLTGVKVGVKALYFA